MSGRLNNSNAFIRDICKTQPTHSNFILHSYVKEALLSFMLFMAQIRTFLQRTRRFPTIADGGTIGMKKIDFEHVNLFKENQHFQ